jgi:hypothetical protein
LLHDVELAFGAIQVAYPDILRHGLEVAEGLENGDLQPEPLGDAPDVGRRPVIGQQVVFKDFNTVEPDGGSRSSFSGKVPLRETVAIDLAKEKC